MEIDKIKQLLTTYYNIENNKGSLRPVTHYLHDVTPQIAKTAIALHEENTRLREALRRHHMWQLDCEYVVIPNNIGGLETIDCEYHESSLYEQTNAALYPTSEE